MRYDPKDEYNQLRYTLGMLIICFILSIKAAVVSSSTNKYTYRVIKTDPANLVGLNFFI